MGTRNAGLDAMTWPSTDIKARFQSLPYSGGDLFGGKFEALLKNGGFTRPPPAPRRSATAQARRGLPTQTTSRPAAPVPAIEALREPTPSRMSTRWGETTRIRGPVGIHQPGGLDPEHRSDGLFDRVSTAAAVPGSFQADTSPA